ncbi:EAL domain-containing protein [Vibrio toranzoniae]|uniref:Diguanylate cyclase n=1 Tax=Vibrio toranzoniae TaxID=1194427 RepID=A0A109DBY6_9VIBR|nr:MULTISPECIES: GGDEF and EAL domain-containing protein [Vibrio]KWU02657.1 diguanylate cyclase [Vibrio toranzoniae]MDA0144276.1 GGDEF and EAL domain-containing protein [Vibrio sp. RW]NAZ51907.1 EAL domain-containing protein [Vibrio toranzoniae]SBS32215.1 Phytochrome-like protein cph2 [Vibrio toranzoniae]
MKKIQTLDLDIPDDMKSGWQNIVDLLAELTQTPAALIMRVHANSIEVFSTSNSQNNPYTKGDSETLGSGLYCESVMESQQQLIVPNALSDPQWENNPDIELGLVSYCGIPLLWPNGELFGTICILDSKENHYTPTYIKLLESFRTSIESQLKTLFQHAKLTQVNRELKNRVYSRTKDLASLNYSLNQEIDKRRAAEQKINFQKNHDLGTGFLNRNAFESRLNQKLLSQRRLTGCSFAVIHIGFTNGRRIQARYGYSALDQVLVEYRKRINNIDDIEVLTARPTSVELVLAFSVKDVHHRLEELCQTLVKVGHSEFLIENDKVHLHAFIGIAITDKEDHAESILQKSSEAMLACKDSGQKFAYYSQSHTEEQSHINKIEGYLLQAVRNDDLMLYFQPKVCPLTHRWLGAEALLRWRHPILGDISNETLIHMAEQNGLIFEVGSFVLRNAIEKAKEWSEYVDDFKMAVNVSAVQLKNAHFAEQVVHLLETYHLKPSFLELEVTESGLIADEVVAKNTLELLHDIGVTLSLDDFGTGYASFSYLKKFPFDSIKIDKSFIDQMLHSNEDSEIVRSIVQIAKKLDLKVIIEGIESEVQEQFIIDEGCDVGQGYLYGKPMPSKEFEHSLINQNYLGTTRYA